MTVFLPAAKENIPEHLLEISSELIETFHLTFVNEYCRVITVTPSEIEAWKPIIVAARLCEQSDCNVNGY